MKPSKSMDSSRMSKTYFSSKLFRGVSTGKPKPLHNLAQLNYLKHNPKTHILDYEDVTAVYTEMKSPKTKQVRYAKNRNKSPDPTQNYASLDPGILSQTLPKKIERHMLPTEQRQILIDHYRKQTELHLTEQSYNNLELIWQHTLSNPAEGEEDEYLKMRNLQKKSANNQQTSEVTGDNMNNAPEKQRSGNLEDESMANENNTTVDKFFKKGAGPDSAYHTLTKQVEYFTNTLKDFYKIISHAQKYYQKAKAQQSHLFHFVSTFVEEVNEIEKMPKKETPNNKLKVCLLNIENKIEELSTEKELIQEQIQQISSLINSSGLAKTTLETVSSPIGFARSMDQSNSRMETHSIINESRVTGSVAFLPEEGKAGTTQKLLEKLKAKTEELKNDVNKLHSQRIEFYKEKTQTRLKSGRRLDSARSTDRLNTSDLEDEITRFDLTYKDSSPHKTTVQGLNSLHINEPSPRAKEYTPTFTLKIDQIKEVHNEDNSMHDNSDMKIASFGKLDQLNDAESLLSSAVVLYAYYFDTLEQLENKITRVLKETKLFQKDFDEVTVSQSTKLLTMQINYCFENLLNEFNQMTKDFKNTRQVFLNDIRGYFITLEELNSSNLLKLNSLKNILTQSYEKLANIEKYCKKFTAFDLTDKRLRKEYDGQVKKFKDALAEDRKTLLFLAEQFQNPFTITKLKPIPEPTPEKLQDLVNRSKMFLRVIFNLQRFPQLEDDFNEKSTKAYSTCKTAGDLTDSLKDFFSNKALLSADKFKEGEDALKNLGALNVKMVALRNELEMISKLTIFSQFIKKPLEISIKLVKKIDITETQLRNTLNKIKESLINDYDRLMDQCEGVENELNGHVKRLIATSQHLNFSAWKANFNAIDALRAELVKLNTALTPYLQEKYPPSVGLLPRPQEKKEQLKAAELRAECLMKMISTGRTLEPEAFFSYFLSLSSANFKKKLSPLYQRVQEEVAEKEKVLAILEKDSELIKRMVTEVMSVLLQLRLLLKKTLETEDKISKEYTIFEDESLGKDFSVPNPSAILELNRDKYPKIVSIINLKSIQHVSDNTNPSIIVEDQEESTDRASYKQAMNPKSSSPSRPITIADHGQMDYPNKMVEFISRLKAIYKAFYNDYIVPSVSNHQIFAEIYNKMNSISTHELELLEKIQIAIFNVQVNRVFYYKEIRPLTRLYKYFNLLNKWSEKLHSLRVAQENMSPCLAAIKKFESLNELRGGVDLHVIKYCQIQEMISNSLELMIDLFQLGNFLNEKEIRVNLSPHVRVERGNVEGFLVIIERKFAEIKKKYLAKKPLVDEETGKLIEKADEFIERVIYLMRTSELKYRALFRRIAEGLSSYEGDFVSYIETSFNLMKEFAEEFEDILTDLGIRAGKSTWIVTVIEGFYQDIILKDLHVFTRLYEESHQVQNFSKEFIEKFINGEILTEKAYKNIELSDPSECDRNSERAAEIIQTLNSFLLNEEVICRPELKNVIVEKVKHMTAMKRVLGTFAIVYSMNRKFNDNITPILESRNPVEIVKSIPKVDSLIADIIKHLSKTIDDSKNVGKIEYGLEFSFDKILKDDVMTFYIDAKHWLKQVKDNLTGVSEFYLELKKKYKNHIIFLREDWISFVKDWVFRYFVRISDKISTIKSDYHEMKERMDNFVEGIETVIKNDKITFLEIIKRVEFFNEHFFTEWFFNSTEERDYGDKLLPTIYKLIRELRQEHLSAERLRSRVSRILENFKNMDQNYNDIARGGMVERLFEGISRWTTIESYYLKHNFKGWIEILNFALNQMILDESNAKEKSEFVNRIQTNERLNIQVQQDCEVFLTPMQKEFLAVVLEWMKK